MESQDANTARLQELLLSKYGNIYVYLSRFGFSVMDKEDVLQDVFIVAYNKLDTLKDFSKLDAWLKKIAERTAFCYIKKTAARAIPSGEIEALAAAGCGDQEALYGDVYQILRKHEDRRELLAMLDRLPPHYYNIIRLIYVQELNLQEAASLMEINYNTAKTLHARALKRLREIGLEKGGDVSE